MDTMPKLNSAYRLNRPILILWITVVTFLAGCAPTLTTSTQNEADMLPTPTTNPIFSALSANDSTIEADRRVATPRPIPTLIPITPSSTQNALAEQLLDINIYTDDLNPDWVIQEGHGMDIDAHHTAIVHGGRTAIAATPTQGYGLLFFAIGANTNRYYLRDEVVEISFWLNGGDSAIALDDLLVTILGSNRYPYWVDGDNSVVNTNDNLPLFSGTRLYFLDFNRPIPPQTWVNVRVRMEDRIYDPDYQYVTGFYIKNDEDFFETVYIDDVQIKMSSN